MEGAAILTRGARGLSVRWVRKEPPMDLVWLGLVLVLTLLSFGLIALCDRAPKQP
jgi:hypothetical protein